MRCARCLDSHLVTEEFHGQMIDACPRCHGVWLTRQDFEQFIGRRGPARPAPAYEQRRRDHGYANSHDSSGRLPAHGRRRSWLSDLFD